MLPPVRPLRRACLRPYCVPPALCGVGDGESDEVKVPAPWRRPSEPDAVGRWDETSEKEVVEMSETKAAAVCAHGWESIQTPRQR
jgi:hypothetical protein